MNRPQNSNRHIGRSFAPHWRGFTLIEMLVASALVVLMMTIFAEVFQMASGSMTLQRTIAENDQQVRTFTTIMRGDLQKRTFRNLVPFFPREDYRLNGVPFDGREGYFYVSGNDPNDASDTVLQFTVDSRIISESADQTPFYGRSSLLAPLNQIPNQPESDDGQIQPNSSSASAAAEICYFVRNGILYRRVVLLRQPISALMNNINPDTIQPRAANGAQLLTSASAFDYWRLFDHAAYRSPGVNPAPFLLGFDASNSVLDNTRSGPSDAVLGRSRFRFGFDNSINTNPMSPLLWSGTNGLPREFFGGSNDQFLGRFTHEETSDPDFRYPCAGSMAPGGNPFATGATLLDDPPNQNGIPDLFEGGERQGQDILLTHVHSFEVEFFDERLQAFAPVGHQYGTEDLNDNGKLDLNEDLNGNARLDTKLLRTPTQFPLSLAGDLEVSRCLNLNYFAPRSGGNGGYVFDSWHPWYDQNGLGNGDSSQGVNYANAMQQDLPPYRPMRWDPIGISAPIPINPGGRPIVWQPGVDYQVNDIVFPPTEDTNYDGVLDANGQYGYVNDSVIDAPGGDPLVPAQPYGRVYYYICRRGRLDTNNADQIPNSYTNQPLWGSSPGILFGHKDTSNPNTPNMAQWEAVLNLRPVRAMRMTVRFLHRGSNKLRQITLVHSLRNQ